MISHHYPLPLHNKATEIEASEQGNPSRPPIHKFLDIWDKIKHIIGFVFEEFLVPSDPKNPHDQFIFCFCNCLEPHFVFATLVFRCINLLVISLIYMHHHFYLVARIFLLIYLIHRKKVRGNIYTVNLFDNFCKVRQTKMWYSEQVHEKSPYIV